jgi:LssY-like putative type I secretion system component LssY
VPKITTTGAGIPGDPLNVALVGSEAEILAAFKDAGWARPAPIDIRSSVDIARSVVLDRPDPTAPVSNLYLFGRREDLAFEQEVGKSAKERNHVRFWRSEELIDGRPLWLGAATFDRGVGLSSLTGQITHHIAADVDTERDRVIADLERAGQLRTVFQVTGVGATFLGRNGGGDPYHTDGELDVGVLKRADETAVATPAMLPNPPAVAAKQRIWAWLRPWLDAVHHER